VTDRLSLDEEGRQVRCERGHCARMGRDGPGLCDPCAEHHGRRLSDLATLADRLHGLLGRGQGADDRVSGSREPPLPVREAVLSFLGQAPLDYARLDLGVWRGVADWRGSPQTGCEPLPALLGSWCRHIAAERSVTAPGPPRRLVAAARYAGRAEPVVRVGRLVSWLQRHHDWATTQDWADEYAAAVHAAWVTARTLADAWETPTPIAGIVCPECDLQTLYRPAGSDRFCNRDAGGCGHTLTDDDFERWAKLLGFDVEVGRHRVCPRCHAPLDLRAGFDHLLDCPTCGFVAVYDSPDTVRCPTEAELKEIRVRYVGWLARLAYDSDYREAG